MPSSMAGICFLFMDCDCQYEPIRDSHTALIGQAFREWCWQLICTGEDECSQSLNLCYAPNDPVSD